MERDDVQLIDDILSGDDGAFNILIEKYQKSVHALAWRKIGDFHYAEEITQDTFLRVYKKLSTLKNPNLFAGWLYVIASNLCTDWLRKKKPAMESLEGTSMKEIEEASYVHYLSEQQEIEVAEKRSELVKKILEKLPDSERTVLTLYYLGEMTTKEIGKFLGVSVHTITSRLQRARKRLQEDQELLIQEVLSGVQIPVSLRENIMRQVADIKPTPPSTTKPVLPWVALGATVVLVLVLLGASNRYLTRFQKPYSFEAASEPTIEIIDAPVVLDIDSKPDIRNQAGQADALSKNSGTDLQASETLSTNTTGKNPIKFSTSPWTQALGPPNSPAYDIFATSKETLYVSTQTGIYRLPIEATAWTHINANISTHSGNMSMVEHGDTLYIVSADEIFASNDDGETWGAYCPRPDGDSIGLIITDAPQATNLPIQTTMYLVLRGKGVYRSTDAGAHWETLNEGLADNRVYVAAAIGSTVFVGTNDGLYRLNSEVWEKLSVGASKTVQSSKGFENKAVAGTGSGLYRFNNSDGWEQVPLETFNSIHSLEVFENNLYVGIGADFFTPKRLESRVTRITISGHSRQGWIFRSTDLGESWTEITPKGELPFFEARNKVRLLVAGDILFTQGDELFRSTDAGQTWTKFGVDTLLLNNINLQGVAVGESTFYATGMFGVYQTTNAGDSWHPFTDGIIGTRVRSLVTFNNRFYAYTGHNIAQSTDGGDSWKSLPIDAGEPVLEPTSKKRRWPNLLHGSRLVVTDKKLYGIAIELGNLCIFRLSTDGNTIVLAKEIPSFDRETLSTEMMMAIAKAEQIYIPDDMENDPKLARVLRTIVNHARVGGFAVSGETFYVEYQRSLFKWKPGDPEWTNTGLIDLGRHPDGDLKNGFKLAASGETVYVGKRDGLLFQSLDEGNNWRNITPNLPLRFTRFKEIVFMGSTVYVATEKGVLTSQTGEHWRVLTDEMRNRITIDGFTVDGNTVYGAGESGSYRLGDYGKWEQISPRVPGKVADLVVNDDRLYIATRRRGMFHISLVTPP